MTIHRYPTAALLVAASTPWAAPHAAAVQPERFVHTTEADFEPGDFDNTTATALGDLRLAPASAEVNRLPAGYSVIYDIATVGGRTYIAAGPEAAIFRLDPDAEAEAVEADAADGDAEAAEPPAPEAVPVVRLPESQIFCLAVDGERLLAGISAETGTRVASLDLAAASTFAPSDDDDEQEGAEPVADTGAQAEDAEAPNPQADTSSTVGELNAGLLTTVAELADDRYIWDLLPVAGDDDAAAGLLIATGIEGRIHFLARDADAPELLLDTAQANVLALAGSGQSGGLYPAYAGTDTDGIVYRLAEDGTAFAVFDAPQPEVGALAVGPDGALYLGTADANQSRPGRLDGAATDDGGRPDTDLELAPTDADAEAPTPDPIPPAPEPVAEADDLAEPGTEARAPTQTGGAGAGAAADDDDTAGGPTDGADRSGADPAGDEPEPERDYDTLREAIRQRLLAARKSGTLAAGTAKSTETRPTSAPTGADAPDGNAVYRIDPAGFSSTLFSESVVILDLHLDADAQRLLVATGSEGQVYAIDLASSDSSILRDYDAEQVNAFGAGPDGGLLVGTSNAASVHTLTGGLAESGTYTSDALDAGQPSLWGKLALNATTPEGAALRLAFRAGNTADPDAAAWSAWSDEVAAERGDNRAALSPLSVPVDAPPARYLQYRLHLEAGADGASPEVASVAIAYITPNLPPRIASLSATYPEAPEPGTPASPNMTVEWQATDANGDRLLYTLEAQPDATAELLANEGAAADTDAPPVQATWLTIAEDLTETRYEWNTRTFPTGRYTLRVRADDRLDNPTDDARTTARRSDTVVVDNDPPSLENVATQITGKTARLSGTASDTVLPIGGLAYKVGEDEQYRPILPEDLIYDSTSEDWSVTLPRLKSGAHVVSLRAIDQRGNTTYRNLIIQVP